MMKLQSYRLPMSMINDLNFISRQTGASKSHLVRQGVLLIVTEFFKKEEIRQKQQEKYERNNAIHRDENWIALPDQW